MQLEINGAAANGDAAWIRRNFPQNSINGQGHEHRIALIAAIQNDHTEALQALLDAGVNVEGKLHNRTALYTAALAGNTEAVQVLLNAGADTEAKPRYRGTALCEAARNGHAKTVQALLAAGADIEARDDEGKTALHWAAENGHTETVQVLLAAGADEAAKFVHSNNIMRQFFYVWGGPKLFDLNNVPNAMFNTSKKDPRFCIKALAKWMRLSKDEQNRCAADEDCGDLLALLKKSDKDLDQFSSEFSSQWQPEAAGTAQWKGMVDFILNKDETACLPEGIAPEVLFATLSTNALPAVLKELSAIRESLITLRLLNNNNSTQCTKNFIKETINNVARSRISQCIPYRLTDTAITQMIDYLTKTARQRHLPCNKTPSEISQKTSKATTKKSDSLMFGPVLLTFTLMLFGFLINYCLPRLTMFLKPTIPPVTPTTTAAVVAAASIVASYFSSSSTEAATQTEATEGGGAAAEEEEEEEANTFTKLPRELKGYIATF
jgi:hypothetical protein